MSVSKRNSLINNLKRKLINQCKQFN